MAHVKVTLTGDEQRLLRSMDKIIQKETELARKAEATGEASKRGAEKAAVGMEKAGKARDKTFGQIGLDQIAKFALAFGGVNTAISGVKRLVSDVTEALKKNKAAVDENVSALSRFSALATLGPEDREFLFKTAGALELGTAAQIGFAAKSAEFRKRDIRALFRQAEAAQKLGEDPQQFAQSIIALKQGVFAERTISQISNFLSTMAEKSPLSADIFAQQFTKISGITGAKAPEAAGGAALLSGTIKALGAGAAPELATTAVKGFLVRRQVAARGYLQQLGVGDLGPVEQIMAMSEMAKQGQLDEAGFLGAFGQRAGPSIMALLKAPEALTALQPDVEAGVGALAWGGRSMVARRAWEKGRRDPEWAMVQKRREAENRRRIDAARRGYAQAPLDLALQQWAGEMEEAGFGAGLVGAARTGLEGLADQREAHPLIGFLRPFIMLVGAIRENTNELRQRQRATTMAAPDEDR